MFLFNWCSKFVCVFGWLVCVLKLLSDRYIMVMFVLLWFGVVIICIVVLIELLNLLLGKCVWNVNLLDFGCSLLVVLIMFVLIFSMCVSVVLFIVWEGIVSLVLLRNVLGLVSVMVCVLLLSGLRLVLLMIMLLVLNDDGMGFVVNVCVS